MKIALVHDGIITRGGAERVLLNFQKSFPDAPIFTTVYHRESTYKEYASSEIITSWYQKIAKNEFLFKVLFFPFGILAAKSLDLSEYDVILCSTTTCGKYIKVNKKALVINYCYTPFRLAWNPSSYRIYNNFFYKILLKPIIFLLRKIDYRFAQRANFYIAMTEETAKRIEDSYNPSQKIKIIMPSIDTSNFSYSTTKSDYFLVVSRLEKYKKVDLVIEVFNELNKPLVIIGKGTEEKYLKKIANKNIKFYKNLNQKQLKKFYSEAKALIFPQHEDYGLTVLESYASGRPAICFNAGGAKFTGIPLTSKNIGKATMHTFNNQNKISLKNAILKFNDKSFDSNFIIEHSKKFDDKFFINKINKFVNKKYKEHFNARR